MRAHAHLPARACPPERRPPRLPTVTRVQEVQLKRRHTVNGFPQPVAPAVAAADGPPPPEPRAASTDSKGDRLRAQSDHDTVPAAPSSTGDHAALRRAKTETKPIGQTALELPVESFGARRADRAERLTRWRAADVIKINNIGRRQRRVLRLTKCVTWAWR